jgi:hypothetical protein
LALSLLHSTAGLSAPRAHLLGTAAVIVALHVATGAAAGTARGSRFAALLLGPILHLAGDRLPHQDIRSRRFEIGSGLAGLLLLLAVRRGPLDPATLGAAASSALTSSTSSRPCARAAASSSTDAAAGTAPAAYRETFSSCWPARFSFDDRRIRLRRVKERSLATRAAGAQCGDPAFVSFFLLPLALVAPSFRRTRPSSHHLSIAPAGREAHRRMAWRVGSARHTLTMVLTCELDKKDSPVTR